MLIIMNGMVRSGSTLLFMLLSHYAVLERGAKLQGFFTKRDLDDMRADLEKMARAKTCHVIKTHHYNASVQSLPFGSREMAIFYTHRDLPAVSRSMQRMFGAEPERIEKVLHEQMAVSREVKADGRAMMVAYQDLQQDRRAVLVAAVEHLGWAWNEEAYQAAERFADEKKAEVGEKKLKGGRLNKDILRVTASLKIGVMARALLPAALVRSVRERVLLTDKSSMLQPGHITHRSDEPENPTIDLESDAIIQWRRDFGYI